MALFRPYPLLLSPCLSPRLLVLAAGWWAAHAATPADFERVSELARDPVAGRLPAPTGPLPAELAALDYDGARHLRFRPAKALWRDAQLPFEAMFFHLGALPTLAGSHSRAVRRRAAAPFPTARTSSTSAKAA